MNRHERRRKQAQQRKEKPRWTVTVGDVPIAPNQVVIFDPRTVHILPPIYGSGGEISIEYADGTYTINREKREFHQGDQDVSFPVWPDNAKPPHTLDPMKANEGELNHLVCHLVGWRLTNTAEIKSRLIPLLRSTKR